MMRKDLLVEIGTEELPPRALKSLGLGLADGMRSALAEHKLSHGELRWFATPRRLGVICRSVQARQADAEQLRRGPALQAAYDKQGKPTQAATGFARACGVGIAELEQLETDKGQWLAYRQRQPGKQTTALLADMINSALQGLSIPKRMRWGDGEMEFARPVHWSLVMFGAAAVPCELLGTRSSNKTYGHRFHHPAAIALSSIDDYASKLYAPGKVIASFDERRRRIEECIRQTAGEAGLCAIIDPALLDEVTALVEWPVPILAAFDPGFLQLPEEVLIVCMQEQQKYFPCRDDDNKLSEQFICIANISADMAEITQNIKQGNEKVIRPRLDDAAFFWRQDSKHKLADYRRGLKQVIFQQRLGTLHGRTQRLAKLSLELAAFLPSPQNIDTALLTRAAQLSKCDLLTKMVGEFPRLQGVMGRYYAQLDGEDEAVALALDEQYQPRFAGDALPASTIGQLLALADRLDLIIGIFAIGKAPGGDKDPFALRRAAIGSVRIMIERQLPLELSPCIKAAAGCFPAAVNAAAVIDEVLAFMLERLRHYYIDSGTPAKVFDAVSALQPPRPLDLHRRIIALAEFSASPAAMSLVAANKRIANILKRTTGENIGDVIDDGLLEEPAERQLADALRQAEQRCAPLLQAADYQQTLSCLAGLRASVDAFFDGVMVMTDNERLRANRLALLRKLAALFTSVADTARL